MKYSYRFSLPLLLFACVLSLKVCRIPRNACKIRFIGNKNNLFVGPQYQPLYSSDKNNESDDNDVNDDKDSRPPIIPFDFDATDFMREDFRLQQQKLLQQQKEAEKSNQPEGGSTQLQPVIVRSPSSPNPASTSTSSSRSTQNSGSVDNSDNERPAGYDNDEVDPNDLDQLPTSEQVKQYEEQYAQFRDSRNPIVQVLFNAYIGTPYDSKNKREARFVTRSITLISFVIGLVFTGVYYVFPGKFISIRGDTDFTVRYSKEQQRYDPDQLLQDSVNDNFVPFDKNLEMSKLQRENSIERFGDPPRDLDKENYAKPTMKL